MLVDGLLEMGSMAVWGSGLGHMGTAYTNIRNQEYGKAAKNFAEGTMRAALTTLVTAIAIKRIEPYPKIVSLTRIDTAERFCSGMVMGVDIEGECIRNIVSQNPNKFFDTVEKMPPYTAWEMGRKVNLFCRNEAKKGVEAAIKCINQMITTDKGFSLFNLTA